MLRFQHLQCKAKATLTLFANSREDVRRVRLSSIQNGGKMPLSPQHLNQDFISGGGGGLISLLAYEKGMKKGGIEAKKKHCSLISTSLYFKMK
jgi:hypothetical protein